MLFVFVVLHSFFSFSDHFPYLFCYFCHVTVYISIHDNIGFQILYLPLPDLTMYCLKQLSRFDPAHHFRSRLRVVVKTKHAALLF